MDKKALGVQAFSVRVGFGIPEENNKKTGNSHGEVNYTRSGISQY